MATGSSFKGFIYASTLEEFESQLTAGNVDESQIAFIEDECLMWTHGKYFPFDASSQWTEYTTDTAPDYLDGDYETERTWSNRYKFAYGIRRVVGASSYTLTRIGSSYLHKTLPIQSLMVGCLLDDDGTVNEYLEEDDWTASDLSGDSGQVMVELPDFYGYWSDNGTTQEALISQYNISGFTSFSKMYVSAYNAYVDSDNKLCSISAVTPTVSVSLTDFRTYARNRGSYGQDGCGWNCFTERAWRTIFWFYTIEYASFYDKDDYNEDTDDNGYKQGGIGYLTSNVYSGNTDIYGNGTIYTDSGNRYRGLENLNGSIGMWIDGCIKFNSVFYVTDSPSDFSSNDVSNYTALSGIDISNGYVQEILWESGYLFKTESGGSSTTYFTTYQYFSGTTSGTYYGCFVGRGYYYGNGYDYGLSAAYASNAVSTTHSNVGSRLCFYPAA